MDKLKWIVGAVIILTAVILGINYGGGQPVLAGISHLSGGLSLGDTLTVTSGGANITGDIFYPGIVSSALATDSNGKVYGTSTGSGGGGSVTSVGMTVPTGLSVGGQPITTSGTLTVSLTSGYEIPKTARIR